jgi:predicted N-acetyltransferase YhbS
MLLETAGRYETTAIVAVYGTAPFWARFGFVHQAAGDDAKMTEKLSGYGEDAKYLVRQNNQGAG